MTLTFEQAIADTEILLSRSDISDMQLGEEVAALITTESGARGFFVAFLTGEWKLADRPSAAVIQALRDVPHPAAELLVKNLAMSTAMAITHRRNAQEEMAKGSDRVQRRTLQLIQVVNSPEIRQFVQALQSGSYEAFFQKWGYDFEQRQAIADQLSTCLK